MPLTDTNYKKAQTLGLKEYRACIARGEYPYLSVLDELLPPERQSMGTELGLMQIPARFIVGTKTAGRTTAFARNFMPLLQGGTEFSDKWERLCSAHLKEGIRDPIKVYEYMNRYYVQEGNKRVSVLKYFGAVTVLANVIRILPERSDAPEVQAYFAYIDFFRCSKVNFLEFSRAESYAEFLTLVGKEKEEPWTEDERKALNTVYYYFKKTYDAAGGTALHTTPGDALLSCMRIYGYQPLRGMTEAEMKKAVAKVWEEIALQQKEQPIDLKLEAAPNAKEHHSLLSKLPLAPKAPKTLKVAYLYDRNPDASGWTYSHELGRKHVERVFGEKVETTAYFNATNIAAVLEEAINDGANVVFTTSPMMLPDSLRLAVAHPEVKILNCSLNQSHRYIRTYYARMFEAKFIIGAIAGALADNNRVGYLCDYPIYGMIAGINAFARGVQMVNPRAKVYLEWTSTDGVEAATERLTDRGIDLISNLDMPPLKDGSRSRFGLSQMNSDAQVNLAMPVWDWGVYYELILRSVLSGNFQSEEEDRALNYYYGMKAGVVDVLLSKSLPSGVQKLALVLKSAIVNDLCYPFFGPLVTQEGKTVLDSLSSTIPVEQIISMDWLLDNVMGEIPAYDRLSDEAKATVDQAGVTKAKKKQ